jgi:uncharacterized Fe-S center protein
MKAPVWDNRTGVFFYSHFNLTIMSKVFYTSLRTSPGNNLLQKLGRLIKTAGFEELNLSKKFAAIKIHFGEPGNLSFIRPNYTVPVVKKIKEKGGIPFLTDSNTLYKGLRSDAINHLESAFSNGFNPMVTQCQVVIADGLKGTDYKSVEINQKHLKQAKIGAAIANADVVISMNHFKGHEMAGFGGCLKNLGMGSASIGGKLEMHSNSQPQVNRDNCVGCGECEANCAHGAIEVQADNIAAIDYSICVGCGQCVAVCQYESAQVKWENKGFYEKMAEYAMAVLKDKQHFHINFIMDVSPNCDCWGSNDIPIVHDIGILASTDPVAIDKASVDLVNKAEINPASAIGEHHHEEGDRFGFTHPKTNWRECLDHAEAIGLGSQQYELVEVN